MRRGNVFRFKAGLLGLGMVFCFMGLASTQVMAEDNLKQKVLVDEALITFNKFKSDPQMEWFNAHIRDSKGILIVPELIKAGFILGGSGGRAVLMVCDEKTGEWSQPVFYSIGAASFGLQIGAQSAEMILLVRTQNALDSLYATSFKLGADTSVAVGPVGVGASDKGVAADLLSFSYAMGAFAGIALDGSVIDVNDDWNKAYYGKEVRPTDILVKKEVSNPHSDALRKALADSCKKKE